jgi:RNA polymerase sigma factor (TIGR02999 family)
LSGAEQSEVTVLLRSWAAGDDGALDRLTDSLLPELRRIARRYRRNERDPHGLETTALINEVYLRLFDLRTIDWQNRAQFFTLIARLVRNILVDAARRHASLKRGGAASIVALDDAYHPPTEPDQLLLALDQALEALAQAAPRQAKVVELRYFGGLTEEETARTLDASPRTVRRDWNFARAWLMRHLQPASR